MMVLAVNGSLSSLRHPAEELSETCLTRSSDELERKTASMTTVFQLLYLADWDHKNGMTII